MQRRWRLPASEIVYVADNPAKDFQAPKQLGMKSIWFDNADGLYRKDSGMMDIKIIHDIREVRDIVIGTRVRPITIGGYSAG